MKKKIIALTAAAAVGICGCAEKREESLNIIDGGEAQIGSSTGGIDFSGSESGSEPMGSSQSTQDLQSSQSSQSSQSTQSSQFLQSSQSSSSESGSSAGSSSEEPSEESSGGSSGDSSGSSSEGSSGSSSSENGGSSSSESSGSSSSGQDVPPVIEYGENSYRAMNYSEVKGIWISYIDLAGLPSGSEGEFRSGISAVYDNCVNLGINTVYVHVRSHGDAYYSSDYYPRTKYLGGSYDPLTVMVEEAHNRGLSFQAWINPLRACSVDDIYRQNGYRIYDWAGEETRLVRVGSYYYLNPAYEEVIELISNGAREIAANYNVDGVHIDDYFYPTTDASFDSRAFADSGYSELSEFRLSNCDNLVSSLYKGVKLGNSSAVFGVSCQGSLYNNYNYMYADVEKWCSESGYVDYIMPQIYYGFSNSAEPFEECVGKWNNIAYSGNIPLIVGITASKIGYEDTWAGDGKEEWITDSNILMRQFLESAEQPSYGGIGIYSYGSVFNPDHSVKEQVDKEIEALKSVMNQ